MKTFKTIFFSLIITFNLVSGITSAQAPDIEWQKSLGGSDDDIASSIQQTADGGYIIVGSSYSNDGDVTENQGNDDFWIVKLDDLGIIEWQNSFGGSSRDIAYSVQQTPDGGYIVAGESFSNDGDVTGNQGLYDFWIIKLDDQGVLVWQKTLGGSGQDLLRSIQHTNDNGYIVAGISSSTDGDVTGNHGDFDIWVVKLNEDGNLQWQKSYGGSESDFAYSVQQTTDGGYIVAGGSYSNDGDVTGNHGDGDYWVLKLNSTGNIQWQKTLGGTNWETARSIQQTLDGGYIICGESSSTDGDVTGNHEYYDFWVVKLTESGTIEWQQSYGGSALEVAYSVQQTIDGGYVIAGYSNSTDEDITANYGGKDYWVVKISAVGIIEWQRSMGGSSDEEANSIQQTLDGGYIIAGYTESNDAEVSVNHGGADYWVVKLKPDPLNVDAYNNLVMAYPNPVTSILNIAAKEPIESVAVLNSLGQEVMASSHFETVIKLDLSGLLPNIYFIQVTTEKSRQSFKIAVR